MDNRKMRLGLYRKIEIARKQLPQMDEEAFRALLRSEFGVESRMLWLPDTFGYSAVLPQLLRDCGVEYLVTQKIFWICPRITANY